MSNALAETAEAKTMANVLIAREFRRTHDRPQARLNVARALGVAPGTIENIQRGRLKRISGWLRDALRARVVRELEAEVVRLQHEIDVYRQIGTDPRSSEMASAMADHSALLSILGRGHR